MKKDTVMVIGVVVAGIGFVIGSFAFNGNPKEIYYVFLMVTWLGIGILWGNLLRGS